MLPAEGDADPPGRAAGLARERLLALIEKNWAYNRDIPPDQIERAVKRAVAEARRRPPS